MKLSFKHFYFRWVKNLFFLFILFAFLMTLARGTFAFVFGDLDTLVQHSKDVYHAMFLGFRYDLMPLAYINALPFILLNLGYFLSGKVSIKIIRSLIVAILCFGYFVLMWLYVFDYSFYNFFQEHINILFFGFFEDDTLAIIVSVWKNYNLALWLSVLFIIHYAVYLFIKFLFSPYEFDLKAKRFDKKMPVIFFSGLVLMAFLGRGNFTRLPLSIEDAHISSVEFINKLSLNGPICLNRAVKIRRTFGKGSFNYLKNFGFADWQSAVQAMELVPKKSISKTLLSKTPSNPVAKQMKPHVVLVVMESYGTFWDQFDSETFNLLGSLKSHYASGLLFKNFLPAENGTIGSIVSVATSQVIRPGARFLSESEFMSTALKSAGHLPFKEQGYETHFMYGGKLGWRDLGKYLKTQGYDNLWGAEEIKEAVPELNNLSASELGNEWGIFDEYLYAFLEEQLRTATRPQFFLVLTTSNHPPFEVPSSYKKLPLVVSPQIMSKVTVSEEMAQKRFMGVQYGNEKMGQFLNQLKNTGLNSKTVVAFTGDHSYWIAKGVGNEEEFKRYAVPFFISAPKELIPEKVDLTKFGSHEDIFPTLYHLTLSDQAYIKLGENLFIEEGRAQNSTGLIANKSGAIHHGKFWKWKDGDEQILEPGSESPELLKLKSYSEGLISITDLYLKEEKTDRPSGAGNDRP